MADDLRLNLGALRSAMQLTLHTHHASRIWHGRTASPDRSAIIGLAGFAAIMTRMKRGAEQDDPYSDWWMLRVESKLELAKQRLQQMREQVDQVLSHVPAGLSLGDNCNIHPVQIPLFVNAQLGFLAVYLLADFDVVVRRLLLAHHTALIDRPTLRLWLDESAHELRSTFAVAQRYRYSGARRDDFAANNAVARAARDRFGDLPEDVLAGTRRSRFAPPIIRYSPLAAFDAPANSPTPETDAGADASERVPGLLDDDEDESEDESA